MSTSTSTLEYIKNLCLYRRAGGLYLSLVLGVPTLTLTAPPLAHTKLLKLAPMTLAVWLGNFMRRVAHNGAPLRVHLACLPETSHYWLVMKLALHLLALAKNDALRCR